MRSNIVSRGSMSIWCVAYELPLFACESHEYIENNHFLFCLKSQLIFPRRKSRKGASHFFHTADRVEKTTHGFVMFPTVVLVCILCKSFLSEYPASSQNFLKVELGYFNHILCSGMTKICLKLHFTSLY